MFLSSDVITSPGKAVGIPMSDTNMNVYVYEDNTGTLVLARTYHHILLCVVSTMQPICFGFVRILLRAGSSF